MTLFHPYSVSSFLKKNDYHFLGGNEYQLDDTCKLLYDKLSKEWHNLPPDNYLSSVDANFEKAMTPIYRFRRWGQFLFDTRYKNIEPLPYQAFIQDSVASKMEREVAPWLPQIYQNELIHDLIRNDYKTYKSFLPLRDFFLVNVHLMRIVDGNPSPEGIHRDDVDFFSVRLINISNAYGGEAEIYSLDGCHVATIPLKSVFDSYFINDRRLAHRANPITRIDNSKPAVRDILIISFLQSFN